MHGLLIINKPEGITSFDVVRRVRKVFGIRKTGHGGTLDPLATGVLPVAIGQGTRLLEFVTHGSKVYRATFKLGETTDTQDCQGTVLERRPTEALEPDQVEAAILDFVGTQEQLPPMYSALKHQGTPLYRYARQGVEIPREVRRVEIAELNVEKIALPHVVVRLRCSRGTYVRTLIHDIGVRLAVGAHMTQLTRLASEPFGLDEAIDFAELDKLGPGRVPAQGWYPLLEAVRHYPQVELDPAALDRVLTGIPPLLNQVVLPDGIADGQTVALVGGGELRAMADFAPGGGLDRRGDFKLIKVFHV